MNNITASAKMYPVRQSFVNQFTTDTSLACMSWVSFDNLTTSLFPFVAKLQKEATPSNIVYMFSKMMIMNHSFNVKVFNSNIAIIVSYEPADFMMKVIPLISNSFVEFSNPNPCLIPLDRTFSPFGEFPLTHFKPLLTLDEITGIGYAYAIREGGKVLYSNINPNLFIRAFVSDLRNINLTAKYSKPFICWSSLYSKGFNPAFRNSMKLNKKVSYLADFKVFLRDKLIPTLRIGNAVIPMFAFESWIASIRLCKEFVKGFYNSVVNILQNLRMNISKFWVNYSQIQKHRIEVLVRKIYSFLLIPYNLVFKLLVVKQSAYLNMLVENILLLFTRINPELIHPIHGVDMYE